VTAEEYLNSLRIRAGVSPVPMGRGAQEEEERRRFFLPNGSHVMVRKDMSDEEATAKARERFPEAFAVAKPDVDSGPLDAFSQTFQRTVEGTIPGVQAMGAAISGDEEAYDRYQAEVAEASRRSQAKAPGLLRTEDITKAYEEEGLLSAVGTGLEFGAEQIGSSMGRMAPSALVGGTAGAVAGAGLGMLGGPLAPLTSPLGAKIGGFAGMTLASMAAYMSEDLERSYEEGLVDTKDVNIGRTIVASGGQAALDSLGFIIAAPLSAVKEPVKKAGFAALGNLIDKIDDMAPVKRFLATLAEEEVAEIGQQALERWQAGLEVSPANQEAAQEYAEIAFATLFPAAGFAGVGAASAKYSQHQKLLEERKKSEIARELPKIMEAIEKDEARRAAELIESDAADKDAQPRTSAFWRSRAAELTGGLREQFLRITGGAQAVTPKDIHRIAEDRNILWDDDPAFLAFTKRMTGSFLLDSLDQPRLRAMYDRISAMPRQEQPSILQYASAEEAISLAERFGSRKNKTVSLATIKSALGLNDPKIKAETSEIMAQGVLDKMVSMRLVERSEKGDKYSLVKKTLPPQVGEDTYSSIIDDTVDAGEFPSQRKLAKKYGIKNSKVYKSIRDAAARRLDIVERDGRFVPFSLDESLNKNRFQLKVNGELRPQFYSSREEAEAARDEIHSMEGGKTPEQADNDQLLLAKLGSSRFLENEVPSQVAEVVEVAGLESPEAVSSYNYNVSHKERSDKSRSWVVRDKLGSVVKIFQSRKKALDYKKNADQNTYAYDVTKDGTRLGRFSTKEEADAFLVAQEKTIRDRKRKSVLEALSVGVFSQGLVERQADSQSSAFAKSYMKDVKVSSVGVGSGLSFRREVGFKVSETSLDRDGTTSKERVLEFIDYSREQEALQKRLDRGEITQARFDKEEARLIERAEKAANSVKDKTQHARVGRESVRGRLGVRARPDQETTEEGRRLLSEAEIARGAVPDPELREIPVTTLEPGRNMPEAPDGASERLEKIVTSLRNYLKGTGLDDVQVKISESLETKGASATFDDTRNLITLAYDPSLQGIESAEEIVKRLIPLVNHETIHVFRKLNVIKAIEWKSLTKYVSKKKISDKRLEQINDRLINRGKGPLKKGSTYLDYAYTVYSDMGNRIDQINSLKESLEAGEITQEQYEQGIAREDSLKFIKDDYVEEAVAQLYQDYSSGAANIAGQPKGLLLRSANVIKSIGRALIGQGYKSAEDVFANLYGDQMASRIQGGRALDLWWSRRPGEVADAARSLGEGREALTEAQDVRRRELEYELARTGKSKTQAELDEEVDTQLAREFGGIAGTVGSEAGLDIALEAAAKRAEAEADERKEERKRERSGRERASLSDNFSNDALRSTEADKPRSRSTIIHISPQAFLDISNDGRIEEKYESARSRVRRRVKFSSVPYIGFVNDGDGTATVVGHEGRHRAMALLEEGVESIPVEFRSLEDNNIGPAIRWDVQNDPDNMVPGAWPRVLVGQDGRNSIPFPVEDLRSAPASRVSGRSGWRREKSGRERASLISDEDAEAAAETQRGEPEIVMDQITAGRNSAGFISKLKDFLMEIGDMPNRAQRHTGHQMEDLRDKLDKVLTVGSGRRLRKLFEESRWMQAEEDILYGLEPELVRLDDSYWDPELEGGYRKGGHRNFWKDEGFENRTALYDHFRNKHPNLQELVDGEVERQRASEVEPLARYVAAHEEHTVALTEMSELGKGMAIDLGNGDYDALYEKARDLDVLVSEYESLEAEGRKDEAEALRLRPAPESPVRPPTGTRRFPPGGSPELQDSRNWPTPAEIQVLSGQPFSGTVENTSFEVVRPLNAPKADSSLGNASWFKVNYDGNGNSSESGMPLVVLSGHHEPAQVAPDGSEIKERGFGAAHIESHNQEIEDLTSYNNWQELVTAFSRAMRDFPAKVKTGEITPYAEPGSVSYIWNDPSSEADNILIHTVSANKEGLGDVSYLVSAYPTDTFSVVGGSRRNKTGHLHGPDASVESVKTFLNPGNARKFGDSDRRRHAVDSYEGRPPKVREAMEQVLGRSRTKNMRTLWGSLGEALRSTDKSMIDKWTAMTMNRFKRIERYGEWAREKASKLGLEGLHDLADVSAHSMALMSDKAQSLLASSMRDGILTYRHGVPMVETLKLVTEARAKVIDPTTGDLVDGDLISIPDLYSEGQTGGMFPMLEALATPSKNLIPELMLYMRALRGYRLDREGRSSGLSKESIEAGFQVAKDNPEIVVVAQNLQNWNEGIIQLQVDAGLITKEMGDVYRKYSDYIPFYLNLEDTTTDAIEDVMLKELGRRDEMFLAGGIANQNPSRKFKGIREGAEFENPIESITKNAKAAIHSSLQNIASQRAIRDMLMLGLGREVRSSDRSKLGFSDRGRMVTVRHRGEPRHFLLDDPLFHEAMVGAFDGISPWMEHLGMPARVLRGLVTRSPEYLIANMLRDSMHVYILNGGESTPIIDASKTMTKNLTKMPKGEANETYTLLQRLGVVSGVEQAELTPERLANRFARKTGEGSGVGRLLTKLWDVTGEMSSRSESATRENVYETTYQHALKKYSDMGFNYVDSNGINVAERKAMGEAANQAIEVLNFSRRGNNGFVKFVTATVPFLNSRLQGLGVMARSLRGNSITGRLNPDATKRVMINRAMTVSTISALYAIMSEMDEDWDNIPSEIRENNWLIPITFEDKRWLSIPIPFEAGVAWKAIPEMITRLIMGQLSDGRSGTSSKEFFESFRHHIGSTLNFNPLPQALRPLYEWLANQNIFTGNPIVPHWQENMKASEQFGDSTTAQAILAGKMTGLSPKKIDNTMKTIFGGVGIWGIQMVDFMLRQGIPDMPTRPAPRLTDLPIIRRFVKDAYGPGLKNDFYDIRSSVRGVVQAINQAKGDDPERAAELIMDNRELLSARKAVGVIDKRLSKIRKARSQAFRNNTLTREMDDKLDEMEKEALKMVPTLKRMIAGWE